MNGYIDNNKNFVTMEFYIFPQIKIKKILFIGVYKN